MLPAKAAEVGLVDCRSAALLERFEVIWFGSAMNHAMAIGAKDCEVFHWIAPHLLPFQLRNRYQMMRFDELVLRDTWVSDAEVKSAGAAYEALRCFYAF